MSTSHGSQDEKSVNHENVSHADIEVRAYEKWQQRGCPLGDHEQDDWHAAEKELQREREQANLRTPEATPKLEIDDNIHGQLQNFMVAILDEAPRPTARRIGSADMSLLRFRA
jgi:Protein of unknown function (DUF2934)